MHSPSPEFRLTSVPLGGDSRDCHLELKWLLGLEFGTQMLSLSLTWGGALVGWGL